MIRGHLTPVKRGLPGPVFTVCPHRLSLNRQAGRYAHAREYKGMRRVIKRQRTIGGQLLRDIDRKATPEEMAQLAESMHRVQRLKEQKTKSKNKYYAMHASLVR